MPVDDARLEAAEQARLEAFRRLGTPDSDVLAARIEQGPYFWPGRRTYRAVRRDDAFILASWGAIVRDGARDVIVEQLRAQPNGYRCRLDRPVLPLAEDYVVEPYRPEPAPPRRPWWKFW